MKVAIAQINTTVGDIQGNLNKALGAYNQARVLGSDLVVFPELTITGYPPEDLLFRQDFLEEAERAVQDFAAHTTRCAAVIGFPRQSRNTFDKTNKPYNTAAMCSDGKVVGIYRKVHLPNYGVFDEQRYFQPGWGADSHGGFSVDTGDGRHVMVGVSICEDAWVNNSPLWRQSHTSDLLVNLSASPYSVGRHEDREHVLGGLIKKVGTPLVYANLVGGQDELVFDGNSLVFDEDGAVIATGRSFVEEIVYVDLSLGDPKVHNSGNVYIHLEEERDVYSALVLGTRDYVRKNGFHQVLIGLSGGIDSSLVASVAVDALGPENVFGVLMPSRYSSDGSIEDALTLATNLGIKTHIWEIGDVHDALLNGMKDIAYGTLPLRSGQKGLFPVAPAGNAEENIQARARGHMLMALSNLSGAMVLTTGNKSEMAVGYATLYGDMAGGFAVIKDVPKTMVFRICQWLNDAYGDVIPQEILDKPPSAELRPDQKDTDSLPPYEVLDPIIEMYVEQDHSPERITEALAPKPSGPLDLMLVQKVCRMIDLNEYKRRQAPPGIRITPKAFGRDRRLPIVNGWSKNVMLHEPEEKVS